MAFIAVTSLACVEMLSRLVTQEPLSILATRMMR